MRYKIEEVLDFMSKEPKSRKQIEEQFGLSNSESWHLVRWLEKGGYIDTLKNITIAGRPNRLTLFKKK